MSNVYMNDSLYREIILDHYKNPKNYGRLQNPDALFIKNNPFCGDEIGMEIIIGERRKAKGEKRISEIKFNGEGCAISIASASMLTENVLGKTIDQVNKMKKEDILDLLKIELSPTRLKCALLPLEVLHKTIHLLK